MEDIFRVYLIDVFGPDERKYVHFEDAVCSNFTLCVVTPEVKTRTLRVPFLGSLFKGQDVFQRLLRGLGLLSNSK